MSRRKKVEAAPEPQFEPIAYKLNWKPMAEVAVVVIDDSGKRRTTVDEVLSEAMPDRFNPDPTKRADETVPETEARPHLLTIKKVAGGTIQLDMLGDGRFGAQLTANVLNLMRLTDGSLISPLLFYYAHDRGSRDATWWDDFRFFVVEGDAIVDEDFRLSSLCNDIDIVNTSVLGPRFEDYGYSPALEDVVRSWYRRFYTETRTGQRIVSRDDGTPIYHYTSPERREAERDAQLSAMARSLGTTASRLARLEVLLVVVVVVWLVRGCFGGR